MGDPPHRERSVSVSVEMSLDGSVLLVLLLVVSAELAPRMQKGRRGNPAAFRRNLFA